MYETPEQIVQYLENHPKKPFLLCEYMHDMGNSLGGLEAYIRFWSITTGIRVDLSGIISIRHFGVQMR